MSKWINTKHELPLFHVDVLICHKGRVYIGQLCRNSHKFITSNGDKYHKTEVPFWQQLPEPPIN